MENPNPSKKKRYVIGGIIIFLLVIGLAVVWFNRPEPAVAPQPGVTTPSKLPHSDAPNDSSGEAARID